MSQTLHVIPAATVTHTIAVIHGDVTSDIAVYHARTTDARIGLTFGTTLMSLYSADATQGLLEAFATARNAMARVPRLIAAPPTPPYATVRPHDAVHRMDTATRFCVVPQSGPARPTAQSCTGWICTADPSPFRSATRLGLMSTLSCSPGRTRQRSRCSSTGPTTPPTRPATTTARRARDPLRPGRLTVRRPGRDTALAGHPPVNSLPGDSAPAAPISP